MHIGATLVPTAPGKDSHPVCHVGQCSALCAPAGRGCGMTRASPPSHAHRWQPLRSHVCLLIECYISGNMNRQGFFSSSLGDGVRLPLAYVYKTRPYVYIVQQTLLSALLGPHPI